MTASGGGSLWSGGIEQKRKRTHELTVIAWGEGIRGLNGNGEKYNKEKC